MNQSHTEIDGATLAILSNRFEGICRKMSNTLLRAGRSGVLNRARDFSCCIVTADCELLAAAESLPIHVLSGPDLMSKSMLEYHPDIRKGDAFLHNSPYHGCSHPADHTILVPVIDDNDIHRYTIVAKAHQADIGNSIPTTYHGTARDVYEEGALIFPAVQVQRDYKNIEDIIRMCKMRIRVPEQWWGDFLAMLGAARIGERELLALGGEVGWHTLDAFRHQWFEYTDTRMMEAIRKLPRGSAESKSVHDPLPGTPEDGIPIHVTVSVNTQDATIEVDLRNNLDSLPCGLNVSEACTRTAAMIGVFNCLDSTVPKNAGSFKRIKLLLKEGSVVGIPLHPSSCSVATTNLADRVASAVQTAIATLGPGVGMAEFGAVLPPSTAVISGVDPRTGKPFVNQLFLGASGGAASPKADSWITYCHAGNGGLCFIDSIELDEMYQPILVKTRALMKNTEGGGEYIGAPSMLVEYAPVDCMIEAGYVSDGVINNAQGVQGGLNGGSATQYKRSVDGELELLPACTQALIDDGEAIVSVSTGGGGYGSPMNRNPEWVARDVKDELISRERAVDVYGVELDKHGNLDENATLKLRQSMTQGVVV
jgi:N-methylhydantoinase B/oxoprolinase/acetone carboxylase alpha subunit